MKHHEYQIYYGGFKEKLYNTYYCKTCGAVVNQKHKILFFKINKINVRSHKK